MSQGMFRLIERYGAEKYSDGLLEQRERDGAAQAKLYEAIVALEARNAELEAELANRVEAHLAVNLSEAQRVVKANAPNLPEGAEFPDV